MAFPGIRHTSYTVCVEQHVVFGSLAVVVLRDQHADLACSQPCMLCLTTETQFDSNTHVEYSLGLIDVVYDLQAGGIRPQQT